jgi:H+/Cl- antiporter ClcA
MWVLLAILGFCTALTSYLFDFMEEQIFDLRRHYFQDNIVVWTIWRVALACAAVGVTRCSSKAGAFSGITEMRVILSGFELPGLLTLNTLGAKLVGLLLAIGSGMPL